MTTLRSAATCLVVLASLACAGGVAAEDATPALLSLSGTGKVAARPDMAEVRAGVIHEAPTAAAAVESNARAMRAVLDALSKLGVADKDVRTERVDLAPQLRHDERGAPPRIVGYRAASRVVVRVRDLDRVGAVLDGVVRAGANEVQGIAFSVAEPEPLLDEARKRAVADARRKAALYAEAAGMRLGRLVRLEEPGAGAPPPVPVRYARAEAAMAVPVAPGELELTATVHVTWELE